MVYSQDEYERIGNLQELGTIDNLNGLLTSNQESSWLNPHNVRNNRQPQWFTHTPTILISISYNFDRLGTIDNLNGLLTQQERHSYSI
jgi:hypothetical protein